MVPDNLTRMQKRTKIWEEYPKRSLIQICQDVHDSLKGCSVIHYQPEELVMLREFLKVCLETWDQNHCTCYDEAVRMLVTVTHRDLDLDLMSILDEIT